MSKSTRMFGLGVFLVVAPLLAAVYGIVRGEFFFNEDGKGIAMLIIFGFAMLTVMSFYAASKIDVSKNAKIKEKVKEKEAHLNQIQGAKKSFVQP